MCNLSYVCTTYIVYKIFQIKLTKGDHHSWQQFFLKHEPFPTLKKKRVDRNGWAHGVFFLVLAACFQCVAGHQVFHNRQTNEPLTHHHMWQQQELDLKNTTQKNMKQDSTTQTCVTKLTCLHYAQGNVRND